MTPGGTSDFAVQASRRGLDVLRLDGHNKALQPNGVDVEAVLRGGTESELLEIWSSHQRASWKPTSALAGAAGNASHIHASDRGGGEQPEVSALDALRANTELVDLLIGRRWMVIQDAREAGATWEQIGQALGMSRRAARNWYKRKIRDQERYVADRHDVRRGRDAVGKANS
jgi:hypothetical protein